VRAYVCMYVIVYIMYVHVGVRAHVCICITLCMFRK